MDCLEHVKMCNWLVWKVKSGCYLQVQIRIRDRQHALLSPILMISRHPVALVVSIFPRMWCTRQFHRYFATRAITYIGLLIWGRHMRWLFIVDVWIRIRHGQWALRRFHRARRERHIISTDTGRECTTVRRSIWWGGRWWGKWRGCLKTRPKLGNVVDRTHEWFLLVMDMRIWRCHEKRGPRDMVLLTWP